MVGYRQRVHNSALESEQALDSVDRVEMVWPAARQEHKIS